MYTQLPLKKKHHSFHLSHCLKITSQNFAQKSKLHKISENSPRSSKVFLSPVRFKRTLPCRRSCYHEDPPKKYWSHPEDLLDHSARPITMDPDDPHGPHGFQQRTGRKQVINGQQPHKNGTLVNDLSEIISGGFF